MTAIAAMEKHFDHITFSFPSLYKVKRFKLIDNFTFNEGQIKDRIDKRANIYDLG